MKKLIITEEERKSILGLHYTSGVLSINEQNIDEIKEPRIVNAVNKVLEKLLNSPKFGTADILADLIDKKKYIKAYKLHNELNIDNDYVDYELLEHMYNNPQTAEIKKMIPDLNEILTNFYS